MLPVPSYNLIGINPPALCSLRIYSLEIRHFSIPRTRRGILAGSRIASVLFQERSARRSFGR